METLKHFTVENTTKYIVLKASEEELSKLLVSSAPEYRDCYVSEERIEQLIKEIGVSKEEIIKSFIPDNPSIMSGDFGEITAFFLVQEMELPLLVSGPKKWRWKEDKNRASINTDVVLFHQDDNDRNKDFIVAAESKMKAVASNHNPISSAVEGSNKDHVSRLAKTLQWLKDRATKDADTDMLRVLKRFIDSQEDENGEYKKKFRAIAFVDLSLIDAETLKDCEIPAIKDELQVIVIGIPNLQAVYESVFKAI